MDITTFTETKILDGIGDWWGDLTGAAEDYIAAVGNITEFFGIIARFATGDFSELSSQGSLAGSFSGSNE
ncbi:MAG TPA: hypothetical protein H9870_12040 [Candidatus Corynebacterium avicola]|uniref:Uncharacterized protein n=1 Tax=Candidatus Corynebacterium avicola TaxID=2838527 RepID=A0A9D1RRS5_9CORY|nr:hypothetical protein [Candidatus Corynebacterium avicola]